MHLWHHSIQAKKDGHGSQMDSVPSLSVSACGYTESGQYCGTESLWVGYKAMAHMVKQRLGSYKLFSSPSQNVNDPLPYIVILSLLHLCASQNLLTFNKQCIPAQCTLPLQPI